LKKDVFKNRKLKKKYLNTLKTKIKRFQTYFNYKSTVNQKLNIRKYKDIRTKFISPKIIKVKSSKNIAKLILQKKRSFR